MDSNNEYTDEYDATEYDNYEVISSKNHLRISTVILFILIYFMYIFNGGPHNDFLRGINSCARDFFLSKSAFTKLGPMGAPHGGPRMVKEK